MTPRAPLAHIVTLVVVTALFASTLALAAPAQPVKEDVLVTLADGARLSDVAKGLDVASARQLDERTFLVSTTHARLLQRDPAIASVEKDNIVREARASWDRASWDRASWDRASWDRASWDRASWDRASWDRASWERASWDRASWDSFITEDGTIVSSTWGRDAINAPSDTLSARATVCIVDSGIDASHPQLAPNLWRDAQGRPGIDLVDGDWSPDDVSGHGTHLAGIIAATTDGPMRGVGAPLVSSVRIFGPDGWGLSSDLIEGIDWCTRNSADVILLALTEDAPSKALRESISRAQRAGIVVVAAAGNDGPQAGVSYPGAYPGVLAISAVDPELSAATFNTNGKQISLAAPGVYILSTFPGGYRVGSGTSQAAAFAAGAVAVLIAQSDDERGRSETAALTRTALDLGRAGKDTETGHGLIQLDAALAAIAHPRT